LFALAAVQSRHSEIENVCVELTLSISLVRSATEKG